MNIEKAIELYKKGYGVWTISKKMNIPKTTLRSNLIRSGIKLRKSKRDMVKILHKPVSRITVDAAELLALHAGDGSLSVDGRWSFSSNKNDKNLIRHVRRLTTKVTGVVPNVNIEKSKTEVRSANKQLYKYFSTYYPVGKKSHIVELPNILIASKNTKILKRLLIGLFSADGSFSFKKKGLSPRIEFRVKSIKLRNQFAFLAKKFGFDFKCNIEKLRKSFIFTAYIEKIREVILWMKLIGSECDTHKMNFNRWYKLKFAGVA